MVEAIKELHEICDEHNRDVVDYEDGELVSDATRAKAIRFLEALPQDIRMPNVNTICWGCVDFTWRYEDPRHTVVTICIFEDGPESCFYCWLKFEESGNGLFVFKGVIPENVLKVIRNGFE